MSENVLKEIMLEVHRIECDVIEDLPDYKPTLRHRLAMKRIFARFEKNTRKLRSAGTIQESPITEHKARRSIKQRLIIAVLIIILMVFLVGWVVVFVSEKFHGTVYEDNTQLFVVDLENCPQMIEYQYALADIPEGFKLIETIPSSTNVYTLYSNELTGQVITLNQWVKSHFSLHYNTEENTFEEIRINDTIGLYIDFSHNDKNNSTIIWDNEDYIIEISADLDKNNTMSLLNITKL